MYYVPMESDNIRKTTFEADIHENYGPGKAPSFSLLTPVQRAIREQWAKEDPKLLRYRSGMHYWQYLQQMPLLPVTPKPLNELLRGGIRPELFHLFSLPRNFATPFLLMLAVDTYHEYVQRYATDEGLEIYFMDTLNRFDPYFVSQQARARGYNPMKVLDKIMLLRSFTWPSLVGACQEQLAALPPPSAPHTLRVVLANYFFGDFENMLHDPQTHEPRKIFQDVQKIVTALHSVRHPRTYLVMTGPLHSQSQYRPSGGSLVAHLAGIYVRMSVSERYHYYSLEQHPFLNPRTIRVPIPITPTERKHRRKRAGSRYVGGRNGRTFPDGIHRSDPKGFHPKDKYLFHQPIKRSRAVGLDEFLHGESKNK